VGSSCDDELQYVDEAGASRPMTFRANREQVIDGSSGGLCEQHRNCRTVVVGGFHLRIGGRQLHTESCACEQRAVMMGGRCPRRPRGRAELPASALRPNRARQRTIATDRIGTSLPDFIEMVASPMRERTPRATPHSGGHRPS
jgi:hypothetical protein